MSLHHGQSRVKITGYNVHNLLVFAIDQYLMTHFLAIKYTNYKLANEYFK